MGSDYSKNFDSTAENDYNPFNVPSIRLKDAGEFSPMVAMQGCPPLHRYTRKEFAQFSLEKKAAYADGVVRGSYTEPWLSNQFNDNTGMEQANVCSIGGMAFIYLKTGEVKFLNNLQKWCEEYKDNVDPWD